MFVIQRREISTGIWYRDKEIDPFQHALDALEKRDEIISGWPNDGVPRGIRVVNDKGEIIEYQKGRTT